MYNIYIGYNLIYDLGQWLLSDMGCVYTLGTHRNSYVVNNICHDVYSFEYGGWGYYTDEGSRYINYYDNIAYNTKCAGHHQHYGLDNVFINNIYAYNDLYNVDGAILSDPRNGNIYYNSSLIFDTNIVYVKDTFGKDILSDPTKTQYKNFSFDGNTYWSVKQGVNITFPDGVSIKEWENEGKDVQVAIADPMFVDPENYNFELKSGSPAIALGFHDIDTTNVGPDW